MPRYTDDSHDSSRVSASRLKYFKIASLGLTALTLLGTLRYGLLAGLLAICAAYMLAQWVQGPRRLPRFQMHPYWAAAVVIALPLLLLLLAGLNARGVLFGAVAQYQAFLHHMAETVLQIRTKLPGDIAIYLPDEPLGVQTWIAQYLRSQSQEIANMGTAGLHGLVLVYVGIIVGALISSSPPVASLAPLRTQLRERAANFIGAFRQIVVAQFWIAMFNTGCTAIFLILVLPMFGVSMPYASALIAFTFVAGLVPIVGNLACNGVLTLAGVAVSPAVALACLAFLVTIHKTEIFINAKVIGKRTLTATWELLAVMVIGEAIFGVAGLVAAPLFYAYAKQELLQAQMI